MFEVCEITVTYKNKRKPSEMPVIMSAEDA